MSGNESSADFSDYTKGVEFGLLAYVRSDGTPIQRRLGSFATRSRDIVFSTRSDASKVGELQRHSRASFLFEPEGQRLNDWRSALFLGTTTIVENETDLANAVQALSARNPRFKARVERDGLANVRIFSLRPESVEIVDYSKGVGHSEKISFAKNEEV